jgi:hypothetical protein
MSVEAKLAENPTPPVIKILHQASEQRARLLEFK